jgi:formate hydrogenlyase subunit 3/multisubunit Na+/H+ antiporter MnhD subunit
MAGFGTFALLLAFGVMAGPEGGYGFDAIRAATRSPLAAAVVLGLMLIGAGSKAGLAPLHVWLPLAHPAAPSHVSALMSGVMTKVALYGFIRVVFDLLGPLAWWASPAVIVLGALTAVMGILLAIMERDLKRALAYSTIENIGVIFAALGLAMAFRANGMTAAAALAFTAALFHIFNHMAFKSLLFMGAGAVLAATGLRDLDRLGGLVHRMPVTSFLVLVGALAISALPPLNGFASEWLTLQALLHVTVYGQVGDGIAGAVALAALAATAALALFCFVKVVGLVLLGPPRSDAAAAAEEAPLPMRAALVLLAGVCVVLGVVPGVLFSPLVGLAPWSAGVPTQTGLELPGTGTLPAIWIAVVLVALTGVLTLLRGNRAAAPAPAWASGQRLEPTLLWTSAGFTKPLRLVLELLLRPQREITVRSEGGVLQEVSYSGHVPQLIDDHLYAPLERVSLAAAAQARRLQSGSLGTYVVYLAGLVLVLLATARLGWIG